MPGIDRNGKFLDFGVGQPEKFGLARTQDIFGPIRDVSMDSIGVEMTRYSLGPHAFWQLQKASPSLLKKPIFSSYFTPKNSGFDAD